MFFLATSTLLQVPVPVLKVQVPVQVPVLCMQVQMPVPVPSTKRLFTDNIQMWNVILKWWNIRKICEKAKLRAKSDTDTDYW